MKFPEAKDYPRCAAFIRTRFEMFRIMSPKVYEALVTCIGSEMLVRRALTPGENPILKIRKLTQPNGFPVPGMYSCAGSNRNIVYVHRDVAESYEKSRDQGYYFENVLLHEVVHWGRCIAGLPGEIDGKEAGSWFQHKAYGIHYQWHGTRTVTIST